MSTSIDRLILLESFVRIAERGSISAAARDLGQSQATISRHLSALEDLLGTTLIYRTTHALNLTDSGRSVLFDARTLIDQWAQLAEEVSTQQGILSGPLSVVAPIAFGQMQLAQVALTFQSTHPDVQLDWALEDGDFHFVERGCDLWLKVGPISDDRLIVKPIAQIERILVARSDLAENHASAPEALADWPCLALSPFEGGQISLQSKAGEQHTVRPKAAFMTNNIFVIHKGVLAGQGFAILPRWMVEDDLKSKEMIQILPDWQAATLTLNTAYLPVKQGSGRFQAFLKAVQDALKDMDGITLV